MQISNQDNKLSKQTGANFSFPVSVFTSKRPVYMFVPLGPALVKQATDFPVSLVCTLAANARIVGLWDESS